MGTAPGSNNHPRAKRGAVQGWTVGATRRNIAFLRSVAPEALHVTEHGELLHGFAFTLTLRTCPQSAADWHQVRRNWVERMRRLGIERMHWVVEWQARGVPHLHGCFWSPNKHAGDLAIGHWLSAAAQYEPRSQAQHVAPVSDFIGWAKYLAKHAARGVNHYQRSADNIPEGWKSKTGRVWGHLGNWDTEDPEKRIISDGTYFRLRRASRRWRIADARAEKSPHRIKSARTCLKDPHQEQSKLRGISEWIPQPVALALLHWAESEEIPPSSEVEE